MSFDEGDMIAVTAFSQNEQWWTGLLLDDERQHDCKCFWLANIHETQHVHMHDSGWKKIPLSDVPCMPANGLFRRDLIKLP